jgi:hypothetical protein
MSVAIFDRDLGKAVMATAGAFHGIEQSVAHLIAEERERCAMVAETWGAKEVAALIRKGA